MNKTLSGMKPLHDSSALIDSLRAVWTLRLTLGFIVLLGSILFFLGTSWDIQWHSLIGRDRTLIPPHEVMLTGVGLSGLAALTAVFIETFWARHNPLIAQSGTSFADAFHGSLGAYVAGFAALDAAVAFPLVLVVIVALYVPAATDLLVKLEHQTYRAGNPGFALIAFEWPLMPLLAAILIDIAPNWHGAKGGRSTGAS